jgi:hypothetical protein
MFDIDELAEPDRLLDVQADAVSASATTAEAIAMRPR